MTESFDSPQRSSGDRRPSEGPSGTGPDRTGPTRGSSGENSRPRRVGTGGAGADKPDRDRLAGDRPDRDRSSNDRPSYGRPTGDRPDRDRSSNDRSSNDRSSNDRPSYGRPTGDRPDRDRSSSDRSSNDRPSYGRPTGDRPDRSSNDRPSYGRPTGDRPARSPRADDRTPGTRGESGRPERSSSGERPSSGRPDRSTGNPFGPTRTGANRSTSAGGSSDRGGPNRGSDRPSAERGGRDTPWEDRDPYGLKTVRNRHFDPILPDDVQPSDLDKAARTQLKTLSRENADDTARHLAMAARHIEDNPALAHEHAQSAARRAGRIGVVRETLAITAYTIGDYALALRELRTYRRITGKNDQLALMVDSERGLGRPDKALELGRSVDRSTLPKDVQVYLAIAMSGARLDLGQTEAALTELEIPQLDPTTAFGYSAALFGAYATIQEDLGNAEQAERWFTLAEQAESATSGMDEDDDTETIEITEEELSAEEIATLNLGEMAGNDGGDHHDGSDHNGGNNDDVGEKLMGDHSNDADSDEKAAEVTTGDVTVADETADSTDATSSTK